MPEQLIPIYTIGYGGRSLEAFTAVLHQHQIAYLIDIRSAPYSRYKPEFGKEALQAALQATGIRYIFMGNTLGGRPEHSDCYTNGQIDYDKVKRMDFYQEGIGRLQNAFQQQQHVVIMCSEQKPEQCHRALLVGTSLTELDIPVAHIDEQDEVVTQTAVLNRPQANNNLPPTMPPPPPDFDDSWLFEDPGIYPPDDAPPPDVDPSPLPPPLSPLSSPQDALKTIFGYDDFRPLQAEIIDNILAQRDTLVVMPTGGGKSLCYQIPALLLDGLTVVVSPLISLMQDQVSQLQAVGIAAVFLNSTVTYVAQAAIGQQLRQGLIKLLYVAPETLLKPDTLALLDQSNLACLAIDEAHCISQWGHDFRPEYRQIAAVRQRLPHVVTVALTATATPRVQQDIQQTLNFKDTNTFIASFDRPNLFIEVAPKTNTLHQVLNFIASHPDQSGIIYCATRKTVDALTAELEDRGLSVRAYHAGLDAHTRNRNQTDFIRDNVQIMVATIAFGMGIDKPDVRFVLHVDLPQNMEHYYQQIGRAGRDGLRSDCLLLFGYGDVTTIRYFIDRGAESERRGREARLQVMVSWAETAVCRRQQLIGYFGETYSQDNCNMCDNCIREDKEPDDLSLAAQKFLSCVYRTGQLFGMSHIIDVLRGSRSQKVLQKGHDQLSTYNIGTEFSKRDWQHLARQFIQQGLLTQDPEYGSLKLTETAWTVMKGEAKVWGQLAEQQAISDVAAAVAVEYNGSLFQQLRAKRKELADADGLPPYVIFSDRALQEMATYFPHSVVAFSQVHGVGKAKVEQYADIFLPLIRDFCAANGLSEKLKIAPSRPVSVRRTTIGKSRSEEVGELYAQGQSVDELAATYSVKRQTIISHLGKYSQMGHELPLERLQAESSLELEGQTAVLQTMSDLGPERLSPIFQALDGQVSYEELHLMRVIYWLQTAV